MNLIGSGDLAKQIKDVVDSFNTYSISRKGKVKAWSTSECEDTSAPYIVAFVNMKWRDARDEEYVSLKNKGRKIGTIISPKANVSPNATIEEGSVILHDAFIGPGANLDVNVLVGTGAIIEHDSLIGQHTVILTGALINGGCNIGCRCCIGSGAIIRDHVRIVDDVTIGMGAVVTKDILEPGTYIGNPARLTE